MRREQNLVFEDQDIFYKQLIEQIEKNLEIQEQQMKASQNKQIENDYHQQEIDFLKVVLDNHQEDEKVKRRREKGIITEIRDQNRVFLAQSKRVLQLLLKESKQRQKQKQNDLDKLEKTQENNLKSQRERFLQTQLLSFKSQKQLVSVQKTQEKQTLGAFVTEEVRELKEIKDRTENRVQKKPRDLKELRELNELNSRGLSESKTSRPSQNENENKIESREKIEKSRERSHANSKQPQEFQQQLESEDKPKFQPQLLREKFDTQRGADLDINDSQLASENLNSNNTNKEEASSSLMGKQKRFFKENPLSLRNSPSRNSKFPPISEFNDLKFHKQEILMSKTKLLQKKNLEKVNFHDQIKSVQLGSQLLNIPIHKTNSMASFFVEEPQENRKLSQNSVCRTEKILKTNFYSNSQETEKKKQALEDIIHEIDDVQSKHQKLKKLKKQIVSTQNQSSLEFNKMMTQEINLHYLKNIDFTQVHKRDNIKSNKFRHIL